MTVWLQTILIPITFFSLLAHGRPKEIFDLHVHEDLPVYAQATEKSAKISKLSKGDNVVVSAKFYKSFRKVLVTYEGKLTPGYIPGRLILKSQVRSRNEDPKISRPYKATYNLGLAMVTSYLRQGESTFQLSDQSAYETSTFESFGVFFSLFLDMPVSPKWGLRTYISFRETAFKGTVTEKNPLGPSPASAKGERKQSLTGVGLLFKNYRKPNSNWWWGVGGEAAMGNKVSITLDGVVVPTETDEKPFFAIIFGGVGADIALPVMKAVYFVPDVRVGTIISTKPITLYVESFLALAYQY